MTREEKVLRTKVLLDEACQAHTQASWCYSHRRRAPLCQDPFTYGFVLLSLAKTAASMPQARFAFLRQYPPETLEPALKVSLVRET